MENGYIRKSKENKLRRILDNYIHYLYNKIKKRFLRAFMPLFLRYILKRQEIMPNLKLCLLLTILRIVYQNSTKQE